MNLSSLSPIRDRQEPQIEVITMAKATSLSDLAAQLVMASVGLCELALRAELTDVPLDLGKVCYQLEQHAQDVAGLAEEISKADQVIRERQPVARTLQDGRPWGTSAVNEETDPQSHMTPTLTLTLHQLLALSGTRAQTANGIPYLDGVANVVGRGGPYVAGRPKARGPSRQAREMEIAAFQQACSSCGAAPAQPCTTNSGRVMASVHKPRLAGTLRG
jgi:hypothetical protein